MNVVAHNLVAMNANRQYNIVGKAKAKSTEKLSSGYRINRAADDAAGLAISEKMRAQVRGLNKASTNIQDGISLIQVAEGALNESHAVLQRARELAVQAANDTNTDEDRKAIQDELDQITGEVDRIATQTNFNSEIYPLNEKNVFRNKNGEVVDLQTVTISAPVMDLNNTGRTQFTIDNKTYYGGEEVTFNAIKIGVSQDGMGQAMHFLVDAYEGQTYYGDVWNDSTRPNGTPLSGLSGILASRHFSLQTNDLQADEEGRAYFVSKIAETEGSRFYIETSNIEDDQSSLYLQMVEKGKDYISNSYSPIFIGDKSLWIQSGALAHQGIKIDLVDATADGIGLTNPDVSTFDKAGATIDMLDKAIEKVSGYRSTFGAQQNRLEHAMAVDDNTAENTDAAESRIRDTDMAKEMVNYSKHNILEQVGQSMISQANQTQQGIMSILS